MRADRLLSLTILLQSRRRWRAAELAERLEVSERTIYRDLDALSGSGIPVTSTPGAGGGVELSEDWRTQLSGLTRKELHALATVGEAGALSDLGLLAPLRSAMTKVAVSLPDLQRSAIEHARQRLHVDPSPFFSDREPVIQLELLREAAWRNRRVRLTYRDFDGKQSRRVVDPYGLVVKADRWYLVAGTRKGPTVFRGGRIERAQLLEESFDRPASFDLATFWRQWCTRFREKRASFPVRLRLTTAGADTLRTLRPGTEPIAPGEVEVDFEREAIAISQLSFLGGEAEVLAPEDLRARMRTLGEILVGLYRASSPKRSRRTNSS